MTQQIKTIVGKIAASPRYLSNLSFKNNNDQVISTTDNFVDPFAVKAEEIRRHLEEGEQIIGIYGNL